MKTIVMITVTFLLAGCEPAEVSEWKDAPVERVCTTEQHQKVVLESNYCNATTGYFGSFCYGSALVRNCPLSENIATFTDK